MALGVGTVMAVPGRRETTAHHCLLAALSRLLVFWLRAAHQCLPWQQAALSQLPVFWLRAAQYLQASQCLTLKLTTACSDSPPAYSSTLPRLPVSHPARAPRRRAALAHLAPLALHSPLLPLACLPASLTLQVNA